MKVTKTLLGGHLFIFACTVFIYMQPHAKNITANRPEGGSVRCYAFYIVSGFHIYVLDHLE